MKTFLSDIFPKIQRYSDKLDNLSLLTNQHWVSIDELLSSKTVYIFRTNNELLISKNGKVEKANWEYLGNNSLLIDKTSESYLFKHGFFNKNVLALKIDGNNEYAIFINENMYNGELNSIDKVFDFLTNKYLEPETEISINRTKQDAKNQINTQTVFRETIDNEILEIVSIDYETIGAKVYINKQPAKDGTYIYKALTYKLVVENGEIIERFYLEKVNNYIFEKIDSLRPAFGDKVYNLDWTLVLNGKIKYSLFKNYRIENGKIIK